MPALYLPTDVVTGSPIDVDLAADYLELTAFFAADGATRTSDLANAASLGAAEDHVDVQAEMFDGEEEIVSSAATRIQARQDALGTAYPFALDGRGCCGMSSRSWNGCSSTASEPVPRVDRRWSFRPMRGGSPTRFRRSRAGLPT